MPKNVTLKKLGEVIYPKTKWENIIDKPESLDEFDSGTNSTISEHSEKIDLIQHNIREINAALNNKVEKVNGKGLSTNDYTDEDKNKLTYIDSVIPEQASEQNQLADKNFVNSSIATSTATYRGSYNVVNDLSLDYFASQSAITNSLSRVVITKDNNDYVFVQIPTSNSNPNEIGRIERYKYNGSVWMYEYTLNNSGFTAVQWEAINSGITSGLVSKLSGLPNNSELNSLLNGKQDTLVSGSNIKTINNQSIVGSGNVEIRFDPGDKNTIETIKVNGVNLTPDSNKAVNIDVPLNLSDLLEDSEHRIVTDEEKELWNGSISNTITPITYTSSNENVATVDGTTLHINGYGSTVITARAAETDDFNGATASYTLIVQDSSTPITTKFVKVTSADQIVQGGTYAIVYQSGNVAKALQFSLNSGKTAFHTSDNAINVSVINNEIDANELENCVFVLRNQDGNNKKFSLQVPKADGTTDYYFLVRGSGSTNFQASTSETGYRSEFAISSSGVLTVQGNSNYNLRYSTSNSSFGASTSSSSDLYLYMKVGTSAGKQDQILNFAQSTVTKVVDSPDGTMRVQPVYNVSESSGNAFIAEYEVTRFSDIYSALESGKIVTLINDDLVYHVTNYEKDDFVMFGSILVNSPYLDCNRISVNVDDTWEHTYFDITKPNWNASENTAGGILNKPNLGLKEDKSNKVTSISDQSTDTEYPSAKAVYDAIMQYGGHGGSGPAIVELSETVYYGGSNTALTTSSDLSGFSNSDESPITDVSCNTKYFYISIPSTFGLEKVITENNENITDLFISRGQYQQNGISYTLYEFHLSSDIPLDANINITISE